LGNPKINQLFDFKYFTYLFVKEEIKMKKFLGIAISTLLVGSMLIGCGSDAETTTTEATEPTTVSSRADAEPVEEPTTDVVEDEINSEVTSEDESETSTEDESLSLEVVTVA